MKVSKKDTLYLTLDHNLVYEILYNKNHFFYPACIIFNEIMIHISGVYVDIESEKGFCFKDYVL